MAFYLIYISTVPRVILRGYCVVYAMLYRSIDLLHVTWPYHLDLIAGWWPRQRCHSRWSLDTLWISQTCELLMYLDIGEAPRYLRRMKNLDYSFLSWVTLYTEISRWSEQLVGGGLLSNRSELDAMGGMPLSRGVMPKYPENLIHFCRPVLEHYELHSEMGRMFVRSMVGVFPPLCAFSIINF